MTSNAQIKEGKEQAQLTTPSAEPASLMTERKEVLMGLYQENRTHLRHYQSQRATASNIIVVTSLGLVGFIAHEPLSCGDWPLTCGLVVIGLYGTVFTANHFECIDRLKKRANRYCKELKTLVGMEGTSSGSEIATTQAQTPVGEDGGQDESFPSLRALPFASKFRVLWPLTITLIGIVATGYIFLRLC